MHPGSNSATNNHVFKTKPPTRLQKKAPTTLQLNQTPNNEHDQNVSKNVIPFLSPVVLPPASFPTPDHKGNGEAKVKHQIALGRISPVQQTGCGDGSRWKHPAMSSLTMPDSSSLCSSFMSQCTIAVAKDSDSDHFSP
ncbi:hypothetical protein QVD17_34372 [Tagetes erecta]|uniref:Uncharacterized protein n=1 Tax=Tagetes erecta TaxID=13708 RepID=A0AAD8JYG6_TARER|nr:hypothetical protein QVD17_34372 [Tagetes erecta]